MVYLIQKMHISPGTVDKVLINSVLENYLEAIDGKYKLFYQKDFEFLQSQIKTGSVNDLCKIFEASLPLYQKRLNETDSLLLSLNISGLKWKENETIKISKHFKAEYPTDLNQKQIVLEKWIKYYFLQELQDSTKTNRHTEFAANSELINKSVLRLKKQIKRIKSKTGGIPQYLEEEFLQALAKIYDPHTAYFTESANKQFTESLSSTIDAYGFSTLENDEGKIEIHSVLPGSPAWNCNELNEGDIVLSVKFKGKKIINVSELDIAEFYDLLDNSLEKEMEITVLKKDGSKKQIQLSKAKIRSTENVLNSFIVKETLPIGYIPLPSFYTGDNRAGGCANDVAREIIKLKQEGISGLILDLRNNGGGSVLEALNLAGIFIDAAPLCIEKMAGQKPRVLKDLNRGLIYDGPMVILINHYSASASELLAQMLKEQKRAVIVGTNSFGKASGQVIVPFDTASSLNADPTKFQGNDDFLKITVEKFYDLSGNTHQVTGVSPHVYVPSIYDQIASGEIEYSNHLANDKIEKKVKVETADDSVQLRVILQHHEQMKNSSYCMNVKLYADSLKQIYESNSTISLDPKKFNLQHQKLQAFYSRVENVLDYKNDSLCILPGKQLNEIMSVDVYTSEMITESIKDMKTDFFINEAYNLLINLKHN